MQVLYRVVAVGVGLIASWAPTVLRAQVRPVGQAHQLTHSVTIDPSPSPDGTRLVYITVVAGREQLFTMNVDGGDARQITTDDANHEDPAWSPDGHRIAFVLVTAESEVIALVNPDGSGLQRVSPPTMRAIHPNWSPDGRMLAFCADDDLVPPRKNPTDIFALDLATLHVVTLISGGVNTYPAWSPDGRHLAFRRILADTNSEVFLANADGSGVRNLSNHPAFDGWPAWSPDGTRIAFGSNRNGNYQIFIMNSDGSDVRLVANTDGRATAPQWLRDGTQVIFPVCRNAALARGCDIYTVRLDGSAP